jgi:hypothetical protein
MKYKANPVIVDAYPIVKVELPLETGTTVWCEGLPPFVATPAMTARHNPTPGDYLVVQEDGYVYLNPQAVFERKYTAA